MSPVRKIASVLVSIWFLAMIVLGVGGSWLSQGGGEVAAESIASISGIDVDEMEARREASRAEREAQTKAQKYKGDGWGADVVPVTDETSDWAP